MKGLLHVTLAQDSFASTPLFLDPARPSLFIFVLVYYIWHSCCKGFLCLSSDYGDLILRAVSVEALYDGLWAHGDQHSFGLCAHCAEHCLHVLCLRWYDAL